MDTGKGRTAKVQWFPIRSTKKLAPNRRFVCLCCLCCKYEQSTMQVARVVESLEEASRLLADVNEISFDENSLDALATTVSRLETRLEGIKQRCFDEGVDLDARLELAYMQRDVLSEMAGWHNFNPGTSTKSSKSAMAPPSRSPSRFAEETSGTIPAIHDTSGMVSADEFAGVSSYMRGRLTVEKINNAILELTRHAEQNRETVRAIRKGATTRHVDRKHALFLNNNVVPAIKESGSKFFVIDQDLKRGAHLPAGSNSSRSILAILRHLGRIAETRLTVDGKTHVVYSLLYL